MSKPSSANSALVRDLEAILFVASGPLTTTQLAAASGSPDEAVEVALAELAKRLQGGIRLSSLEGAYRLVTAPDAAEAVRKFLRDESKTDLTRPALETLAIVAYRGPLTKASIEQIRGVASDTMVRNLLARGLITEAGKSAEPGRPMTYAVSHAFLQHFGLTSLADLPPAPKAGAGEGGE